MSGRLEIGGGDYDVGLAWLSEQARQRQQALQEMSFHSEHQARLASQERADQQMRNQQSGMREQRWREAASSRWQGQEQARQFDLSRGDSLAHRQQERADYLAKLGMDEGRWNKDYELRKSSSTVSAEDRDLDRAVKKDTLTHNAEQREFSRRQQTLQMEDARKKQKDIDDDRDATRKIREGDSKRREISDAVEIIGRKYEPALAAKRRQYDMAVKAEDGGNAAIAIGEEISAMEAARNAEVAAATGQQRTYTDQEAASRLTLADSSETGGGGSTTSGKPSTTSRPSTSSGGGALQQAIQAATEKKRAEAQEKEKKEQQNKLADDLFRSAKFASPSELEQNIAKARANGAIDEYRAGAILRENPTLNRTQVLIDALSTSPSLNQFQGALQDLLEIDSKRGKSDERGKPLLSAAEASLDTAYMRRKISSLMEKLAETPGGFKDGFRPASQESLDRANRIQRLASDRGDALSDRGQSALAEIAGFFPGAGPTYDIMRDAGGRENFTPSSYYMEQKRGFVPFDPKEKPLKTLEAIGNAVPRGSSYGAAGNQMLRETAKFAGGEVAGLAASWVGGKIVGSKAVQFIQHLLSKKFAPEVAESTAQKVVAEAAQQAGPRTVSLAEMAAKAEVEATVASRVTSLGDMAAMAEGGGAARITDPSRILPSPALVTPAAEMTVAEAAEHFAMQRVMGRLAEIGVTNPSPRVIQATNALIKAGGAVPENIAHMTPEQLNYIIGAPGYAVKMSGSGY